MPTGYTAELTEKDVPFEKFVLTCAKAFLGRMRESSGPIPKEFKPSDYHEKEIGKLQAEMSVLKAMNDDEAESKAAKEHQKALKERERYVADVKSRRDRLITMRARVSAWQPPSRDHDGLRKFMIEQLDGTIEQDGEVLGDEPEKKSGKEWKVEKISYLEEEISYHEKEQWKEIRDADHDTLWVKRLRDSLETPHESTKR